MATTLLLPAGPVLFVPDAWAQTVPASNPATSSPATANPYAAGNAPAAATPPAVQAPMSSAPGAPPVTADKPASTARPVPPPNPVGGPDLAPYIIGPNDVIGVSVWDDKNLTGTYAVGPDGRISMALVGDFRVTGFTIRTVQDLIAEKLKDYINDPIVSVQLLRNNSKRYTIVGGVLKTGPFALLQQTTVLDAIAAAGGFKDFSKPTKIEVIRGSKRFPFNYKDVIRGRHMEQNIPLEDGDIINVPGGE